MFLDRSWPDFFSFSFFLYSADHERDWPPCKVVFFGLATNALNVRNNDNNNSQGRSCDIYMPLILLIYSTRVSTWTAESYMQLHSDWLQVQRYICTFVFIGPELCLHC